MATSTINIIIICATVIILAELGYRNRRKDRKAQRDALSHRKTTAKKDN